MSEKKRKITEVTVRIAGIGDRLPDVHTLIMARIQRARERRNRKGRIKIRRPIENL